MSRGHRLTAIDTMTGPGTPGPVIVAHRGSSGERPENTFCAFDWALAHDGARWLELDVHASADGEIYVIHDADLRRTTDLAERHPEAAPMIWQNRSALLDTLDAGGWFHPRFRGAGIPRLQDVLARYGGGPGLMIELKGQGEGFEAEVARLLTQLPHGPVTVWSFDQAALERFHRHAPDIPLGAFLMPGDAVEELGEAVSAIGPWPQTTPELVDKARRRGLAVVATATAPERIAEVHALGVDAIVSDFPRQAAAQLGALGTAALPVRLTVRLDTGPEPSRAEVLLRNHGGTPLNTAGWYLRHDSVTRLEEQPLPDGATLSLSIPLGQRARRWAMLRPIALFSEQHEVLAIADY